MITPSPELLAVSRRWFHAIQTRGQGELKNFISESAIIRFVGTSDGELWQGQAVREAIGAHFDEVPSLLKREELMGEAFEAGELGWSFFNHRFWFESLNEPVEFRTTLIFGLENNVWKITHRHASIPTSNMAVFGNEHTAIQELVEAAQKGFSLGQREGLASIMFTDIVNSSPLAAALGDRSWSRIIADHFHSLQQIIDGRGGQFVKSLGDGTMSSFPSARQALHAAQQIQIELGKQQNEPKLNVRIGLHTGDVVQSDKDFFGTVVNKAARITSVAGPGQICVSDVTRAMVGESDGFMFTSPQCVALKGFEDEQTVHHLILDN